jgi:hypothetical protein
MSQEVFIVLKFRYKIPDQLMRPLTRGMFTRTSPASVVIPRQKKCPRKYVVFFITNKIN